MPEKQDYSNVCGKCGRLKQNHYGKELWCTPNYDGSLDVDTFESFEPQILCGKCGKPKGEHDKITTRISGDIFYCKESKGIRFEPASIKANHNED